MFLLLFLAKSGLGAIPIALVWAAHNLVRTLATFFGGRIADRVDRRRLLAIGWLAYAATYAALACVQSPTWITVCVVAYALHYGAVEPTERAIVADLAPPALRGSAFGWFHGAVGVAALPASAVFGGLWKFVGPGAAFGVGAALALIALVGLWLLVPRPQSTLSR